MLKTIELLYNSRKRERFEHPERFCSYCKHHEKYHGFPRKNICHICSLQKPVASSFIPQHLFNTLPSYSYQELKLIIPNSVFDETDNFLHIRMYRLEEFSAIKKIEGLLTLTCVEIKPLNTNEILLTFSKSDRICSKCKSPLFSEQDVRIHEIHCVQTQR